jgi:hypothetical protein
MSLLQQSQCISLKPVGLLTSLLPLVRRQEDKNGMVVGTGSGPHKEKTVLLESSRKLYKSLREYLTMTLLPSSGEARHFLKISL